MVYKLEVPFGFKIRLSVQRKKFYALRLALGDMRQRTNDADPRVALMQRKVGEIEATLVRCESMVR